MTAARPASKATAPHYVWGSVCDGWRLVDRAELSIILERMPPGASEQRHQHDRARQFFFVITGTLTLETAGSEVTLGPGEGLEIAPQLPHTARNGSANDVEFLVVSQPSTRHDREPAPATPHSHAR